MDPTFVIYIGRQALETALLVSAPALITCLVVGVLVTLLQAVTSIKDMTLTTVPKLLAVGLVLLITGNWTLQILLRFTREIFTHIQTMGT